MIDHSGKSFPVPTPETEIYWEGCREHQLRLQCCNNCGQNQFYPRIICSACMSSDLKWIDASGEGEVISFTIVRRPVSEAYKAEVPYVVALIKLLEGPTMMSNVVACDPEAVEIGMPVSVQFQDWSEQISMPKFAPKNSGG